MRRERAVIKYYGRPVCSGTAAGPVVVLRKENRKTAPGRTENPEDEVRRVDRAAVEVREQLRKLCDKAAAETGEAGAAIFEAHQMLLEDEEFLAEIYRIIRTRQADAEYAVAEAGESFARVFAGMEDEYMKARAEDVRDVSGRLIQALGGRKGNGIECGEPSVIVADDLSPSEAMQLDRDKILAFVTVHGSRVSHTAILARMMNLPALTGVPLELDKIRSGMRAVVDGVQGEVVFEPHESIWEEAQRKIRAQKERQCLLRELIGKENITRSGKRIAVYANIGCVGDVRDVLENDAGGIGLFRSEFLYLGRDSFPGEEEQLLAYRQVLEAMGEKKVVIRTLDIGADKQADYFSLGREENPALGYRAIRICLKQPELFKTQLRALLRAAVYGNLSVMYPMITSVEEVKKIAEMVDQVKEELAREGAVFGEPEQGIMIETPAAVMISDRLAQMVDFFSIGTNDLTQYTLAVDRRNDKVADFYNPRHEAVLRMIRMAADNAHRYGKWVGICGELGADLELTEAFVEMGIDELSAAPSMVLPIRKRIRELA